MKTNILCCMFRKIAFHAHKYTHTSHFTHAHDTVGFQEYSMPKSVHVCSEWVLRGQAKTTVELVCWCWVSMRQGELAGVQASREGAVCYMLH